MKYFNNDIYSNAGSPIKDLFSPIVNEDGTITLEKSGEENITEFINSFAESTDIDSIVRRFTNGEIGILNQKDGTFGDFTNVPKTYAEFLQKKIDAENVFKKLPLELKDKFDNDINKFLVSAGSNEWFEKLGFINEEKSEKVEEKGEVKE